MNVAPNVPLRTPGDHTPGAPIPWVSPQQARLAFGGVGGNAVRNMIRLLSKRRIVAAGAVAAAMAIAILVLLLSTPLYRAASILEVSREAAPVIKVGSESLPTTIDQEFYETQYGLLRGPALARDVVRTLGLATNPQFMGDDVPVKALTPAQRVVRERAAARKVQNNTSIAPARMSRLIDVRYTDSDPVLAANISNALSELYIRGNLTRRIEGTAYARDFLQRRLEEVRRRLEDSERRLVTYAGQQQIISVPTSGESGGAAGTASQSLAGSNLAGLSEALVAARAARAEAQSKWIAAQMSRGSTRPEALQNPAVTALLQRQAELRGEIAQLQTNYNDDYPPLAALKSQANAIEGQIRAVSGRIYGSIQSEYNASVQRESELQRQVDRLKSEMIDLSQRSIQYNILQRDVDTNRSLYEGLLQRYKEIGVAADVGTNNIAFIMRAEPPENPYSPQPMRILLIGLFCGVLAAIGLALLLEVLDSSAATPEDLKERVQQPLLGVVPAIPGGGDPLLSLAEPKSPLAEAYLSAHANLRFTTADGAPRTLAITSTRAGEGKTTSAIALASVFARQGERVLLIDADLRRPSLHKRLGLQNKQGMSDLLAAQAKLPEVVQRWEPGNLDVVTCGPIPPSPAELLGNPRLSQLFAEAAASYDRVIIDSPPVLGLADAPLIGSAAGGVVYVVEANATRVGAIRRGIERMLELRSHVLGVVFAKYAVRRGALDEYGYYDYYSYGSGKSKD